MTIRRAVLLWVIAIAAGLALTVAGNNIAKAISGSYAQAGDVRISGCAIRLYSTGPVIHQNETHTCLGVVSVSINASGYLVIDNSPGGPIVACMVALDETLAERGILAGCSGGVGATTIRFYDTDIGKRVRANSSNVASSYSNIWVTWIADGRAAE